MEELIVLEIAPKYESLQTDQLDIMSVARAEQLLRMSACK